MDNDSTFDGITWGKWIALACLVVAVVSVVCSVAFYNNRRMRRGDAPIMGTAWMLPGYTPAHEDREGIPEVAAPRYNAHVTEEDAGYYDKDGNFIARPVHCKTINPGEDLPPPISPVQSRVEDLGDPALPSMTQVAHATHAGGTVYIHSEVPETARRNDSIV